MKVKCLRNSARLAVYEMALSLPLSQKILSERIKPKATGTKQKVHAMPFVSLYKCLCV